MKRLTIIMIACLCACSRASVGICRRIEKTGHGSQAGGRETRRSRHEV